MIVQSQLLIIRNISMILALAIGSWFFSGSLYAQTDTLPFPIVDYSQMQEYEIGGIRVEGATYSDPNAIISISGLAVGNTIRIPGSEVPNAITALWNLRIFTDVQVIQERKVDDVIFLIIRVQERPRLAAYSFSGVRRGTHDEMNKLIPRYMSRGTIVTENVKTNVQRVLTDHWVGKGFLDAEVWIEEQQDTILSNAVNVVIHIDRGDRVRIQNIVFTGNENVRSRRLINLMKDTRRKRRLFAASRFVETNYEADKNKVIAYYNTLGYKDARIVNDTIYRLPDNGNLMIEIEVEEGNQYYFRNITWAGNSVYSDEVLKERLGIQKGDVFNGELLEQRLRFSPDGRDISSLYMDNGYLFFQVNPVETVIGADSVDLEIRIFEGAQATIDRVVIRGNDRTHEHVIRRELRTKPGEKFSRANIIRSQREIMNLGYFDPESLGINTPVNPARGTVDIEYTVTEKPSDQLELSAGWGGFGRGVIGTLGVSFNNFSVRNILNREAWNPLPQGDGQRLSLRAQTTGRFFQAYNVSFTEPWLGGRKPTSFNTVAFLQRSTNGLDRQSSQFADLSIAGVSVGIGTRLRRPDDFFIASLNLSYQNIRLNDWGSFFIDNGQQLRRGSYNSIALEPTITRNSINEPIFPRSGSRISVGLKITPPYSVINNLFGEKSYSDLPPEEKYRWLEYHKWSFKADWYTPLFDKFVLKASARFGLMGYFTRDIGLSPFERYELGGDGISNFTGLEGKEIISLRGYAVGDLPANQNGGAAVYDKFSLELRYPISLNPNATVYILGFLDGGNAWNSMREFNPFDLRRSAGMGLRVFLPMFGILGFDYGFGFDKVLPEGSSWTEYARFSVILGFEPE